MGVCVMGIQLDGTTEELQSSLMLFLKGIAVTQDTPCLGGEEAPLHGVIGNVTQVHLLLQMPQASAVVLQTFESVRLNLEHVLKESFCLLVLAHLEVAPCELALDPTCLLLFLGQLLKLLDGLMAFIVAHQLIRDSDLTQQSDKFSPDLSLAHSSL